MTDKHSEIWETHTVCWSNPNEKERKEILTTIIDTDCVYTDPNMVTVGANNLSDCMGQFQQGFVGVKFATTTVTVHHDQSLTHWNMVNSEMKLLAMALALGCFKKGNLLE